MSDTPDKNEQNIQDSKNSANANNDANCNNNKNNVNPNFNNANQLIGINIIALIFNPNDQIADLVSNKKIIISIIISIATISLFIIFGSFSVSKLFWQKSNSPVEEKSSEKQKSSTQKKSSLVILQNVASGIDLFSPDLLPILPEFLEETDELLDREQLDRAIRNYNLLITVTDKFQKYLDTDPEEFEDLEEAEKKVTEISTKAKQFRQSEINAHRLSELREQLRKQEFGEIVGLIHHKFEEQYTEGAIQTTYKILMRPYGFHADRNNDGFIDSKEAAEKIPCETLQEIENLWRHYTNKRCGWYGSDLKSINPLCNELSLTETIKIGTEKKKIQYNLVY